MRDFLRFLGIDDVEFVYAEGLNLGAGAEGAALTGAHAVIDRLTAIPVPVALAA